MAGKIDLIEKKPPGVITDASSPLIAPRTQDDEPVTPAQTDVIEATRTPLLSVGEVLARGRVLLERLARALGLRSYDVDKATRTRMIQLTSVRQVHDELPRRREHPTAVLSADVVGYSRMMCVDDRGTWEALHARRRMVAELVCEHGGRQIERCCVGDGWVIEFDRAEDAARCAFAIQEKMREANAGIAEERQFHLRIGVDFGRVLEVAGDQIYGVAVNAAIAVQDNNGIADGVCITENLLKALPHSTSLRTSLAPERAAERPAHERRWECLPGPVFQLHSL